MAEVSRIPKVVIEATALRSLPLGAADGFVLSRIDGRASERELAGLTGLPESQIRSSLDKLFSLKAIEFGAARVATTGAGPSNAGGPGPKGATGSLPPADARPAASDRNSNAGNAPGAALLAGDVKVTEKDISASTTGNALLEAAIAGVSDAAPELLEEVELPVGLRRRILGLSSVIASLDHYAVLALEREADKKTVKRSYFELAAIFHPDRYFRKNLGSFKSKMEVIFAKVSTAYETLADKDRRAEYDAYLGDVESARNVEAMLRNVMAEVETAEQTIVELAGGAPSLPPVSIRANPSAPPPPSTRGSSLYSGVGSIPSPPTRPVTPVADQLRREALAMRLKGSARPAPKPSIPVVARTPIPPPHVTARSSAEAVETLKRRYEQRVEAGRRQQAEKYAKLGETAESRNDLTAAAAAYRVALTFMRQDDAGYSHAGEVIARSETALGETYVRQGEHEERANRWEDALRSWSRAAKLRPNDPRAQERCANALVRTSGDLHEAAQFAQRAVTLAPAVGEYRCTLASVYVAAGLNLNARRELEAAAILFPDHANIHSLLKRLTKPA